MSENSDMLTSLVLLITLLLVLFPLKANFASRLAILIAVVGIISLVNFDTTLVWSHWFFGLTFHFSVTSIIYLVMTMAIWSLYWLKRFDISDNPTSRHVVSAAEAQLHLLLFFVTVCACLVTDMISFYLFNVIASYCFYALFAKQASNLKLRRAAKHFLVISIAADLILFEALVMANNLLANASPLATLDYPTQVSSGYAVFVILGFSLKSGALVFAWWLSSLMQNDRTIRFLPVISIPLAMIGLVRWLPASESDSSATSLGYVFAIIAVFTFFYFCYQIKSSRTSRAKLQKLVFLLLACFYTLLAVSIFKHDQWPHFPLLISLFIAAFGIWMNYAINCLNAPQSRATESVETKPEKLSKYAIYFRWTKRWVAKRIRSVVVSDIKLPSASHENRLTSQRELINKLTAMRFQMRLAILLLILVLFLMSR